MERPRKEKRSPLKKQEYRKGKQDDMVFDLRGKVGMRPRKLPKLDKLSSRPEPYAQSPDLSRAPDVYQAEYLLTSASQYPVIKTGEGARVYACVALMLYDPRSKIGVMAHIDPGTDVRPSLEDIFAELRSRGIESKGLLATLIGGLESSRPVVEEVRQYLALSGVNIAREQLYEGRSYAVSFDLRTGIVSEFVPDGRSGSFADDIKWEELKEKKAPYKLSRDLRSLPK